MLERAKRVIVTGLRIMAGDRASVGSDVQHDIVLEKNNLTTKAWRDPDTHDSDSEC